MKKDNVVLILMIALAAFVLGACTELKTDLPSPPDNDEGIHETGWMDTASTRFHGKVLKASDYDLNACKTCHSAQFTGGTSGESCFSCHPSYPHEAKFPMSGGHPAYLRSASYPLQQCKTCHGANYGGGSVVTTACTDCHVDLNGAPKSPESCNTCHGTFAGLAGDTVSFAPPRNTSGDTSVTARGVGGHRMHLAGTRIAVPLRCGDCHNVPASLFASGHLDSPLPAEVQINSVLARTVTNEPTTDEYDSALPLFTPNPSYDPATGKCSNVYCHGYFKNGNTTNAPTWTAARGTQAQCGSCHGDLTKTDPVERAWPKSESQGGSHLDFFSGAVCADCHDGVIDANMVIIDSTKHMNGKLNVFGGEGDY